MLDFNLVKKFNREADNICRDMESCVDCPLRDYCGPDGVIFNDEALYIVEAYEPSHNESYDPNDREPNYYELNRGGLV